MYLFEFTFFDRAEQSPGLDMYFPGGLSRINYSYSGEVLHKHENEENIKAANVYTYQILLNFSIYLYTHSDTDKCN